MKERKKERKRKKKDKRIEREKDGEKKREKEKKEREGEKKRKKESEKNHKILLCGHETVAFFSFSSSFFFSPSLTFSFLILRTDLL